MNQRNLLSAASWVLTILVVLLGVWLQRRFGGVVEWAVLGAILAVIIGLSIWLRTKVSRKRLEFQELVIQLARGKTIAQLESEHPDFLRTIRSWPAESVERAIDALDEQQGRDLRAALRRGTP